MLLLTRKNKLFRSFAPVYEMIADHKLMPVSLVVQFYGVSQWVILKFYFKKTIDTFRILKCCTDLYTSSKMIRSLEMTSDVVFDISSNLS